ncbi:hypothetical protein MTO96_038521 [Rhipicephalus appendiculatus]
MTNTAEDPTSHAGSTEATESDRAWILAFVLVFVLAVVIGSLVYHFMPSKNASDPFHGYQRLSAYEVYAPQPYIVLDNTTLEQCMKRANNDTEAAAFQLCAPKGMQVGRCDFFTDNARLRTRLADNCDVYFHGLVGVLPWILMGVVLRDVTHLLMDR